MTATTTALVAATPTDHWLSPTSSEGKAARRARLKKLEGVIGRGFHAFLEVGAALREIRDERLYEASKFGNGQTFEAYAFRRFGLSRSHAYRSIDAADVQDALSPTGDKLPSESVARALVALKGEPEKLLETWKRAQQWRRGWGPITARIVAKEVARTLAIAPQKASNGTPSRARPASPSPLVTRLRDLWDSSIGGHGRVMDRAAIDELIDLLNELRNEQHVVE